MKWLLLVGLSLLFWGVVYFGMWVNGIESKRVKIYSASMASFVMSLILFGRL